jgi:hypothetical protein
MVLRQGVHCAVLCCAVMQQTCYIVSKALLSGMTYPHMQHWPGKLFWYNRCIE